MNVGIWYIMKSIIKYIWKRKTASGAIAVVILVGGYFGYVKFFGVSDVLRYAVAEVKKGTLVVSVSGSGQVSAVNQVDIKPKVSGDVVYAGVENGEFVPAGTLIAQLDARDAEKSARDAEANLESAKIALEKLKKPADTLSVLQAENAIMKANETKQKAKDDLQKAYEDGFNTIANAFIDLPGIMTGLHDTLFESAFQGGQWNIDYYTDAVKIYDEKIFKYNNDARAAYQTTRASYDKNFDDYKLATRFSEESVIEALIDETYDTTKNVAEAIKSENNFIQFYQDKLTERNFKINPISNMHLSNLNIYTGKTNADLLNLLSIKHTIDMDKETIADAGRTIVEKTESLAKLKSGVEPLDIESQNLVIRQRENALLDVKEKLADYSVFAPFSGIVAKINIKKADSVSPATIAATLITKQRQAEISFNEVDVAKIKVGQKVTVVFDAIPDLSISGSVAEIDSMGTVLQGVVTYIVKVAFDAQDERVKPGMSVSAAIITEVKQDVLLIPNSAVKTQSNNKYVEITEGGDANVVLSAAVSGIILKNFPRRQTVAVGLSNDESTEIISGLNEGDIVIVRLVQPSAATVQTNQQSRGLRIPGLTGGGGGRR